MVIIYFISYLLIVIYICWKLFSECSKSNSCWWGKSTTTSITIRSPYEAATVFPSSLFYHLFLVFWLPLCISISTYCFCSGSSHNLVPLCSTLITWLRTLFCWVLFGFFFSASRNHYDHDHRRGRNVTPSTFGPSLIFGLFVNVFSFTTWPHWCCIASRGCQIVRIEILQSIIII